ncbi:MAG: hypothetical protein RL033_7108 [Pseudomonadota bacterium]|jgi:hypothetical protein
MDTRMACTALALLGLVGCFPSGPDLPDDRQPRGVRVLGALSQPASGAPGAELALSLEVFDAAPLLVDLRRAVAAQNPELVIDPAQLADAPGGPLSVAWLGGCHNPPGDAQSGCYPLLQEIVTNLPDPLPEPGAVIPAELARFFGVGQMFSLRIPDDILAGRQLDTAAPAFGVSFTFFAVCRGVLRPDPAAAGVPLRCHDRESDELLGAEAFVRGFVTTYTYEGSLNSAPELLGATLDGAEPPQRACASDDDCADLALGQLPFACGRPLAPTFSVDGVPAPLRCLPRVAPCNSLPCARHELLPQLAESSVELDPAATPPGGAAPDEVVWVKYFGFGGFERDEALINDRASGFNPDYALSWSAPPLALETPLPVWAVVQDNRGGTSIARWDFLVRE